MKGALVQMEDVRIEDLLFTDKCDIVGLKAFDEGKELLGEVVFQVVDIGAFTVRYIAVNNSNNTFLIPAEFISDLDEDGLILELKQGALSNLEPMESDWQKTFSRSFEKNIYETLQTPPYWIE